ncbi:HD domain-containing protein [Natronomonas salsuginis]|uniref:HD domain-containing protein n=1 Tax=Natronomonas salsuginis TaxID=2217661 RepID=A0A4U5JES3_9EURY|nr:HD domain-containing protein [Natronomonas salsuginis]TKR26378.1 HD domain-containing protein [Natronomonas salsuginis]
MDIQTVFPEIEAIEDDALRSSVAAAWATAAEDNGIDIADLEAVPWFPPAQRELGIADDDVLLVEHVRDVTACAVGLAESLTDRRYVPNIDMDVIVAGALVHDVSKLYEFDGMERTEIGRLLGHPHFGVLVTARADLPVEMAHIVLSHTPRTNVEPATLEAELVRRADEASETAIKANVLTDLRDA